MRHSKTSLIAMAVEEAKVGVAGGGMPFGAVLVVDGEVVGRGHNRQVQDTDYLAHAETVCLAPHMRGRTRPLKNALLVATEAPCPMCAGAAVVAGIRSILVGESHHYEGALDWLDRQGVHVEVLDDEECIDLVSEFRSGHPSLWRQYSAG
ncbi:nucleoside deaminase [Streptomyces sp. NPDC056190]|uniref:nucleoside deaminase n=1 Tax=Streptomyces sp. NPDC056190 TaxID=3345741 RepID=UPI0035D60F08